MRRQSLPLNLMRLLNLMGITIERVIRRELAPQDDSRLRLHSFVVETKRYIKLKGGPLRMVAFILT